MFEDWFNRDPLADWLENPYDSDAAVEVAQTYDADELEGVVNTLQLLGNAYDEWESLELSRLEGEKQINAQKRDNASDWFDALFYGSGARLRDAAVGTVDAGADVVETGVNRGADIVETGVDRGADIVTTGLDRSGDILYETGDAGESAVYAIQKPTQNAVRAGGELVGEGVGAVSQPIVRGVEAYDDVREAVSGGSSGYESQQPRQPGAM